VSATSADGLLTSSDVRRLVASLELRPTKTLGQNFVIDPNTVRRIVRTAAVNAEDVVLEVGPGLGSLTLALLPVVARVVAVEIDPTLATVLPETVISRRPDLADRLDVIAGDALALTAGSFGPTIPQPTALVANLPYNVSVPVLLNLLAQLPSLQSGLVMVQAEVADRLTAGPGSRTYGAPSVKAAWWASVVRAGSVPRTVFWPMPNVDSGLVGFTRREPPVTTASRAEVFAVIDAAFAQRRKTLRAALAGWAGSPAAAETALRAADLDPSIRGEQLDVAAFARIAAAAPVRSDS
jgi:16S rRNA (adenine1518-N6/adenine1519-N6)-dimethyltransferase